MNEPADSTVSLPPEIPASAALWQEWLECHGRFCFLYARQQTRSESDAKDVFQDALVEAWHKAGDKPPERAVVLATIRRRAVDLGRSIDRRARREQSVAADSRQWFAPDFAAGDTRECVAKAVGELPENLRETLVLHLWGELPFPVIARLTGVPVATATSRYRYALGRLRESLTELKP